MTNQVNKNVCLLGSQNVQTNYCKITEISKTCTFSLSIKCLLTNPGMKLNKLSFVDNKTFFKNSSSLRTVALRSLILFQQVCTRLSQFTEQIFRSSLYKKSWLNDLCKASTFFYEV